MENAGNNRKKNIYWEYRKSDAEIIWIDEETVIINGKKINVLTERYDWRKDDKAY